MESEAQNGAHPAAAHPAAAQPEAAKPVNPLRLARPLEKSAGTVANLVLTVRKLD
jgi:hypothetical protein